MSEKKNNHPGFCKDADCASEECAWFQGRNGIYEKVEDRNLLKIGYHKGEMDFGICGVSELTYEQMKEFREMIVVAIGIAEDTWRRAQEKDSENIAKSE